MIKLVLIIKLLADMYLAYGAEDCRSRQAACLYKQRYPEHQQPYHTTFSSIHRCLRENDNLKCPDGASRPRIVRKVEFEK